MKRCFVILLLCTALLLTGCNKNEPAPLPADTQPLTEPATTEAVPETTAEPTEPPTEPVSEATLGFACGLMAQVGDVVYSVEPQGVCRWEDGVASLVYKNTWSEPRYICTNGKVLYYLNEENSVCGVDLTDGASLFVSNPIPGTPHLSGALGDTVYVTTWPDNDGWAPDIYTVDAATGSTEKLEELLDISCIDGYLIQRGFCTDVSPKETWIYDAEGNCILDGKVTWRTGFVGDTLWYSCVDDGYGVDRYMDSGIHVYTWEDGAWQCAADWNDVVEDSYGVQYLGNCLLAYTNGGVHVLDLEGNPLPADQAEFMSDVSNVYPMGDATYYRTYDAIWKTVGEGEPAFVAGLSWGKYYPEVLISDGIYIHDGTGAVRMDLI